MDIALLGKKEKKNLKKWACEEKWGFLFSEHRFRPAGAPVLLQIHNFDHP
jgi:hypothetical protein